MWHNRGNLRCPPGPRKPPVMKRSREQLKAELLAKMEAQLDDLLEWADENPRPTLTQIEDAVLHCRSEVGRAMAEGVVNAQENAQLAPSPSCPTCGREMHVKDRKRKVVGTRVGDVKAERDYYYCPHCRRGFFPPR